MNLGIGYSIYLIKSCFSRTLRKYHKVEITIRYLSKEFIYFCHNIAPNPCDPHPTNPPRPALTKHHFANLSSLGGDVALKRKTV